MGGANLRGGGNPCMPDMPNRARRHSSICEIRLFSSYWRRSAVVRGDMKQGSNRRQRHLMILVWVLGLGLTTANGWAASGSAHSAGFDLPVSDTPRAAAGMPITQQASRATTDADGTKPDEAGILLAQDYEVPLPSKPESGAPTTTSQGAEGTVSAPGNAVPIPALPAGFEDPDVRARHVLERHCARCHEAGQLVGRAAADGGIANILDLESIARNPALVKAGAPDASPLYQQMISRQMPLDVFRKGLGGAEPTAEDVHAIRRWIELLPTEPREACRDRVTINEEMLGETIRLWLTAIGAERAADTRFISLAHLYNTCADDAELANYRQAVTMLLNGLTWSKTPVRLETVGEALVVMAVRLSELGWTSQNWEALVAKRQPATHIQVPNEARLLSGTKAPVVAADWLAYQSLQPDLYHHLLGLPASREALAKMLELKPSSRNQISTMKHGAVAASAHTGAPRIIERYESARGPVWFAYDYEPVKDGSFLDQPLVPWINEPEPNRSDDKTALSIDTQALFTLPNGFPAYMLFDASGGRVGQLTLPPAVANGASNSVGSHASVPGQSRSIVAAGGCHVCHARGVVSFADALGEHLASSSFRGDEKLRETARKFLFSRSELGKQLADDRHGVDQALSSAGLAPSGSINGHDLATGLAARYTRDLDLAGAAAELLVSPRALQVMLSRLATDDSAIVAELATRLTLGRLTRDEFEVLRPLVAQSGFSTAGTRLRTSAGMSGEEAHYPASPGSVVKPNTLPMVAHNALHLWPDRISYNRGDNLVLKVRSGRACYLTVIDIDNAGKATVLFPNEYTRNNLIGPRRVVRVPGRNAPYQFLMKKPGTESFIAICEVGEPVLAGVRPDLLRENFTALGNWNEFLDSSFKSARQPRVPIDNGDDLDRRRRGGKNAKLRPAPILAPAQSRAAITVTIVP